MIEAEASYQRLQDAVLAYISECDNPVPDYSYRRVLLNRLRQMTGAPEEPAPRAKIKLPPAPEPTAIMNGGFPPPPDWVTGR